MKTKFLLISLSFLALVVIGEMHLQPESAPRDVLASVARPSQTVHSAPASASSTSAVTAFQKLPEGEQKSISEQIREAQYWFTPHDPQWGRGAGVFAPCPGQKMAVHADDRGVALKTDHAELAVKLAGAAAVAPRAENGRLVYDRGGGVEEWYVNSPAGLEQGFTLKKDPTEPSDQTDLTLRLGLKTELHATQPQKNARITFRDATGEARFFCDELKAWDADQKPLPATMELSPDGAAILLAVNDAGARYPVTVDPLFFTQVAVLGGDVTGDRFGASMAVSGNTLAVGTGETGGEYVLVFERGSSGWQRTKKIPAPAGAAVHFGFAVALDTDRLVVGTRISAPLQTAHIFERNSGGAGNWGLVKTLISNVPATPGFFGAAVAVSGDMVAVGAFRENGVATDSGAVTVFQRDLGGAGNWGQEKRIIASDGQTGDRFGEALSLQGERLVVGAFNAGGSVGAAYIYERNQGGALQWGQVKRLAPPSSETSNSFGVDVALDADRVMIGNAGVKTAQIFRRDLGGTGQWGLEQTLSEPGGFSFGASLSLRGTRCLVGDPGFPTVSSSLGGGAAFLFEFDGSSWQKAANLIPSSPQGGLGGGAFGGAVALADDQAIVGGLSETFSGLTLAGQVHVLEAASGQSMWKFSASPTVAAPGAVSLADLGAAVAVDGNTLVIGAPNSDDTASSGSGEGAAYVFYRNQGGADAWQLKRRLLASNLGVNSGFGSSVSVRGDLIAVGAPTDNTNRGEVYVYSRNTGGVDVWGELKRLNSPTNAANEEYGFSVSLDANGTWLAVGAPGQSGDTGQVHVYFINTGGVNNFGLIKTLSNPANDTFSTPSGDRFGHAVSLDWPRLLVGAPNAEGNDRFGNVLANCGRGYVFEINTGGVNNWGLESKIATILSTVFGTEGIANAQQGTSVSLDGSKAALGVPGEAADKGSVNLYERNDSGANTWTLLRKITDASGVEGDAFGASVSLSGSRLAVGAPGSDVVNPDSGEVLVFLQNKGGADLWGLEGRLFQPECAAGAALGTSVSLCGPDLAAGAPNLGTPGSAVMWRREFEGFVTGRTVSEPADSFGNALSLDNGHLAVGAFTDDSVTTNQGSAFLFRKNLGGGDTWGLVKKFTAADGASGDRFGRSIGLSSDILAVGAPDDDDRGVDSGSVYVFFRNQGGADQWGQTKKITPADGVAGDFFGSALASNGEVLAIGAAGAKAGYVFERNQGGLNNWGQSHKVTGTPTEFGRAAAVSGDTVAFGGIGIATSGGGEVKVLARNSGGAGAWGVLKTVAPPEDADLFGNSIDLQGETLVVGAPLADGAGADAGAAFVFGRNTGGANNWGLVKKLAPSGLVAAARFGEAVALEPDRIVVLEAPITGANVKPHVFSRNQGGADQWDETDVLEHPDFAPTSGRLVAVALDGGILAVGQSQGSDVTFFLLTGSAWESYLRNVYGDAVVDDPTKEATHWGDLADFDKDGLTNLEEAFFARNPLVPDANLPLLQPTIVSSSVFALLWAQNPEPFGIRACPEWSTDLSDWKVSGEGGAFGRIISVTQTGTQNGLPVFTAQLPRNGSKDLFLRLHLIRQ